MSIPSLIEAELIYLKPEAAYVLQHADGGYTTNLPLEIFLQDNFLLATHFEGNPLTPEHGAPVGAWWAISPDRKLRQPASGREPNG